MSTTYLVWAEKFQLLEPTAGSDGGYNKKGSKKSMGASLVNRTFVEDRNSHDNNEIYVIDEKKTSELMEIKEEKLKEKAEAKKLQSVSQVDILQSIAEGINGEKVKPKSTRKKQESPKKED